ELEEIVDQHAQRAYVRGHAGEILAARGGVGDEVVADRLGDQLQRGDRRAQVVRDGGDQAAAGGRLGLELGDHRLDVSGDGRELAAAGDLDAQVALAVA